MDQPLYCPQCGYDVRAASRGECPECGQAIDLAELRQSQIPWSHRGRIGRVRAYVRTVWRATFRTHAFCAEAVRPVDYRDARRFQLVTVALAYVSLVGILAAMWVLEMVEFDDVAERIEREVGESLTLVLGLATAASLALFLWAATGVHTYWFHPRSLDVTRQNRAVAMSYYACAPLALSPLVFIGWGACGWLAEMSEIASPAASNFETAGLVAGVATFAITLLVLAGYWLTCTRMLAKGARRSLGVVILFAVTLPIIWALLAALILVGIPVAIVYAAAMIQVIVG